MPATFARFASLHSGRIDRIGIALSGICAVHCVSSVVLMTLLASVGGELFHPAFHEIGLAIAIVLGAAGLGAGIWRHGYMLPVAIGGLGLGVMAGALTLPHGEGEALWTIIGVGLLALGHDLNRRAAA
jgi:hypothetical protein